MGRNLAIIILFIFIHDLIGCFLDVVIGFKLAPTTTMLLPWNDRPSASPASPPQVFQQNRRIFLLQEELVNVKICIEGRKICLQLKFILPILPILPVNNVKIPIEQLCYFLIRWIILKDFICTGCLGNHKILTGLRNFLDSMSTTWITWIARNPSSIHARSPRTNS